MTVCLSMIVKDEQDNIARCLQSMKPAIDCWVIVDTGSTDNTVNVARETMYGIPGEIHQRPWKDFATNRNEALELARPWADYVLFADADMELQYTDPDVLRKVSHPVYNLRQVLGADGFSFYNTRLVRSDVPARYVGVLHEYLEVNTAVSKLDDAWFINHHTGVRTRQADKYQRDAAVLRAALKEEPTNARYMYYLAQSLRDSGEYAEAARVYRERAAMLGFVEETWSAMYENGKAQEKIGQNPRNAYLSAFQFRPSRAEPLYQLARYHREKNEHALAYLYSKHALTIPYPTDILFVEADVYTWKLLDEFSVAAYYVGALQEGRETLEELLTNRNVPEFHRPRIEQNLKLYV